MLPKISKITQQKENCSTAVIIDNPGQISSPSFSESEKKYAVQKLKDKNECTVFKLPHIFYFHKTKKEDGNSQAESARKAGAAFYDTLKNENIKTVQLARFSKKNLTLPFLEGLLLSSYSFSKYKKKKEPPVLNKIFVADDAVSAEQINELRTITESAFHARNLINEPLSYLTAERFSEEIAKLGKEAGFQVEIFNRKKIEALRMGGLLAVNKGSIDPPTFSILEWKPENAKNKQPVVFLNNLGAREGQTSIAGKFLEHFTGYPWLHLDIAGVAYLHEKIAYRPEGGNDFGTRLLCHFLKKFN